MLPWTLTRKGIVENNMENKKQTSKEWELARRYREFNKWAARRARWDKWKAARPAAIMVCQNTLAK